MNREDKDLLCRYLCMALPYGVVIKITSDGGMLEASYNMNWDADLLADLLHTEDDFKPFLRPMSSITLEEIEEFRHFKDYLRESECKIHIANYNQIQWLLEKHFDFMGLIPEDLAIEVTEENNPYKITEE